MVALSAGSTEVKLVFTLSQDDDNSRLIFEDHVTIWRLATSIELGPNYVPQIATTLQFLANPVITNGRAQWPCPRLVHLTFGPVSVRFSKEVVDAVKEFLAKRSGAAAADVGEGSAADTPSDIPVPLEMIQGYPNILDLIRGTEAAEGIRLVQHEEESDEE